MSDKRCRRKAAHAAQGSILRRAFQAGLEALRLESGLSRREFAEQLGIPRSSYFHLMTRPPTRASITSSSSLSGRASILCDCCASWPIRPEHAARTSGIAARQDESFQGLAYDIF